MFWRPRKGVTGLHERFLRRQLASPANVALRTEHGFIIGQRRGRVGASEGFVDDFAVDEAGSWDGDGAALLLATSQRLQADSAGADAVRVVTARAGQLRSPGWSVASDWYLGRPRVAAA